MSASFSATFAPSAFLILPWSCKAPWRSHGEKALPHIVTTPFVARVSIATTLTTFTRETFIYFISAQCFCVFYLQEPSPSVFACTLSAVSEPTIWLHSGAGARHPPGGRGLQSGRKHLRPFWIPPYYVYCSIQWCRKTKAYTLVCRMKLQCTDSYGFINTICPNGWEWTAEVAVHVECHSSDAMSRVHPPQHLLSHSLTQDGAII